MGKRKQKTSLDFAWSSTCKQNTANTTKTQRSTGGACAGCKAVRR